MSPIVAIHASFALTALAIGPVVLWTRLGARIRPAWHRRLGIAWVACMLGTAGTAVFIRSAGPINVAGFSPIHLLVPFTLVMLWRAFTYLRRGQVGGHRRTMTGLYVGACVVAGAFTLLPNRTLGRIVWGDWLGLIGPV